MPQPPKNHLQNACALALTLAIAAAALPVTAQQPAQSKPATRAAAVAYLFPEQVTVEANKSSTIDLHFRVAPGLHINSHTPRTEDLIPTTFQLPAASNVTLAKADFPAGADFTLPYDPENKLSVYTGEFTIHANLTAPRGEHLIQATLRYQACDNSACFPPPHHPRSLRPDRQISTQAFHPFQPQQPEQEGTDFSGPLKKPPSSANEREPGDPSFRAPERVAKGGKTIASSEPPNHANERQNRQLEQEGTDFRGPQKAALISQRERTGCPILSRPGTGRKGRENNSQQRTIQPRQRASTLPA